MQKLVGYVMGQQRAKPTGTSYWKPQAASPGSRRHRCCFSYLGLTAWIRYSGTLRSIRTIRPQKRVEARKRRLLEQLRKSSQLLRERTDGAREKPATNEEANELTKNAAMSACSSQCRLTRTGPCTFPAPQQPRNAPWRFYIS